MKCGFWFACALLPLAAQANTPTEVVDRFHAALLDNMKQGAALSCAKREERLTPVVAGTFDTPFLSRLILRKQWPTLSDEQQQKFIKAIEAMTITAYASNFRDFGGESFATLGADDQPRGQKLVHSKLNRPHDDAVSFDYVMRQSGKDEWRVVNVIAEGVSDLALRSAQYDKLFAEKGFDGLLAWIQSQSRDDKNGC
jgi:phospholipid transport system substrate-binding protein